jgi:hypothetical protein
MDDVQARLSGPNTCVCCCEWIIGSKHISLILVSLVEYTVEAGDCPTFSPFAFGGSFSLSFVHASQKVRGERNTPSAHQVLYRSYRH